MLQDALEYASRGWPIFPCNFDKKPLTEHGAIDATTNLQQIKKWWKQFPDANIAFHPDGAEMVVVDLDPGHDPAEIKKKFGSKFFHTKLVAGTPRKGWHYYFRRRADERIANSASKIAANTDVRSFHGYVLLPPSRTKDGDYEWHSTGQPIDRPDELYEACASTDTARHPDWDDWEGINVDSIHNVHEAIAWIYSDECRPAVEGQGGDTMTYATAGMMRTYGLSEEKALEVMFEHYNKKCDPPWSYDDMAVPINNAYSYATGVPGLRTAEYKMKQAKQLFKPVILEADAGRAEAWGSIKIRDQAAMRAMKTPPWLIHEYLGRQAYAILYGKPNDGKTFVALDIALTLAYEPADQFKQGTKWGSRIGERGPVLFMAGEGQAGIKKREAVWCDYHGFPGLCNNFYLADALPHVMWTDEAQTQFIAWLRETWSPSFKLIVLDTITSATAGESQSSEDIASGFTRMVRRLNNELGATVLALHHTNVSEKRLRGSSVFEGDADTIIRLENDNNIVRLDMQKQKEAELANAEHIRLLEHKAGKATSLVATPHEGAAKTLFANAARKRKSGERSLATGYILAKFLHSRKHQNKGFSDNGVCPNLMKLAADEKLDIGKDRTIRDNLKELRGMTPFKSLWYTQDTGNGHWKWHTDCEGVLSDVE